MFILAYRVARNFFDGLFKGVFVVLFEGLFKGLFVVLFICLGEILRLFANSFFCSGFTYQLNIAALISHTSPQISSLPAK
jgi:hypothetical protein